MQRGLVALGWRAGGRASGTARAGGSHGRAHGRARDLALGLCHMCARRHARALGRMRLAGRAQPVRGRCAPAALADGLRARKHADGAHGREHARGTECGGLVARGAPSPGGAHAALCERCGRRGQMRACIGARSVCAGAARHAQARGLLAGAWVGRRAVESRGRSRTRQGSCVSASISVPFQLQRGHGVGPGASELTCAFADPLCLSGGPDLMTGSRTRSCVCRWASGAGGTRSASHRAASMLIQADSTGSGPRRRSSYRPHSVASTDPSPPRLETLPLDPTLAVGTRGVIMINRGGPC